jgi:hypothetical protein
MIKLGFFLFVFLFGLGLANYTKPGNLKEITTNLDFYVITQSCSIKQMVKT